MNTPQSQHVPTLGLVLAGGEARRMGGNKAFREVGGKSLIGRVIDVAQAQCDQVMISSNAGAEAFADYGLPVVADHPKPGQGPLGGILGGLKALPDGIDWLVTFPVDCPIVPLDMVGRLRAAAEDAGAKAAFASHADRDHYLSSIWHRDAAPVIADLLASDDRRVRGPLQALEAPRVVFEDQVSGLEPFTNVNTPDDLRTVNVALEKQVALTKS
ncbi:MULTISPECIES: molybdenum cofactor guanylyltransferase MobA [unclassified Thalassospira]|uniref:molybdenum cofactor guanylyltransferase MobA n=1 Tax=unclassified Thalassospira TaxID=2648997 RepID=UPI0007A58308|nr:MULTISPECIES: molybdenum cofactor guanylyltransferase MobA [unclassified Thalassospira]KZD00475.1 molybdenum cofactor guanylyltransferase [Thalassospira sp. MCCC 1A02898]ONH86870.1 molybdopterin-guanine dinucleotide biosynthesis protein MobA [Thalassospira sp. MCCC 1A02803]